MWLVELVGFGELSLLYEEMVEGAEALNPTRAERIEQVAWYGGAPATIEHAIVNQYQSRLLSQTSR
jgi:hypothetical protein